MYLAEKACGIQTLLYICMSTWRLFLERRRKKAHKDRHIKIHTHRVLVYQNSKNLHEYLFEQVKARGWHRKPRTLKRHLKFKNAVFHREEESRDLNPYYELFQPQSY